ncbi:MAG: ATP-binding protein [Egibacteraceae bacterium]
MLRTVPELWLMPEPGAPVERAVGEHRERALFTDQMADKLPAGVDLTTDQAVHADFRFIDGRRGGHVSISGISGVATKTSYALFLLYMPFETQAGRRLLEGPADLHNTKALIFNTKGEDLLHIDRPNVTFPQQPKDLQWWAALGVTDLRPFSSVRLYAPRADTGSSQTVPDVRTRPLGEVAAYGWTPEQFIRQQLLQFCFTAEDERTTQVTFVEQQVRIQLLRHMHRLQGDDSGAVVIAGSVSPSVTFNADRLADREPLSLPAGAGHVVRDFGELLDFIERKVHEEDQGWLGNTQPGTQQAFLRRLVKLRRRIGRLISVGVQPVELSDRRVHVVDISRLHDDAQRFVVAALLDRIWNDKQGTGREPLRFIVLDELNKYAPAVGHSPLKELLVDIAERGRSLGVLLVGAQQAVSAVAPALPRNASLKVAGRLDAGESDSYRFLSPLLRERATRFLPGTMVVSQPLVPEPIPIRFPFPPYATNDEEGRGDAEVAAATADRVAKSMAVAAGPRVEL